MSLPRFLAVLFPLFMWLGAWLAEGGRRRRGRGRSRRRLAGLAAVSARVRDLALGRVRAGAARRARHARRARAALAAARRASSRARGVAVSEEDARRRCSPRWPTTARTTTTRGDLAGLADLRRRCAEIVRGASSARARRSADVEDALLARAALPARTPRCPAVLAALRRARRRASSSSATGTSRCTTSSSDTRLRPLLDGGRHLGRVRGRQARPGDLPPRARAGGRGRRPTRCTRATTSRPTSRARARPGSRAVLVARDGGAGPPGVRDGRDARGPAHRLTPPRTLCARTMTTEPAPPPSTSSTRPRCRRGVEPRRRAALAAVDVDRRAHRRARRRAARRRSSSASIAVAFGANFDDPPPAVDDHRHRRAGPLPHRQRDALRAACSGASRRPTSGCARRASGRRSAGRSSAGSSFLDRSPRPSSRSSAATRTTTTCPRSSASTTARRRCSPSRSSSRSSRRSPRSSSSAASSSPRCATGTACGRRRSSPGIIVRRDPRQLVADPAFLVPLAFFGFVLCLIYARTGSLYPCIALHCANNSIAFGVSQHWTWQIAVLFAGSHRDHRPCRPRRAAGLVAATAGPRAGGRHVTGGAPRGHAARRHAPIAAVGGVHRCLCGYICARNDAPVNHPHSRRRRSRARGARRRGGPDARSARPSSASRPSRSPSAAAARRSSPGASGASAGRPDARSSPGQTAVVRFYRDGHRAHGRAAAARAVASGQVGVLRRSRSRRARAAGSSSAPRHSATPQLGDAEGQARRRVGRLAERAARLPRARRSGCCRAQLAKLGYVVGRPGLYDARTARAVLAFRKVTGMRADDDRQRATSSGAWPPAAARFHVRFPSHGQHVEADLSRQVIALIRNGKVERIYPVSSGKPSTPTIRGHFRVYLQGARDERQGHVHVELLHPRLRDPRVPVGARLPGEPRLPAGARSRRRVSIFNWLSLGDIVDVYA